MRSLWKKLPEDEGEWNWLLQAWPESWSLVRRSILGGDQTFLPLLLSFLPSSLTIQLLIFSLLGLRLPQSLPLRIHDQNI